MLYSSPDKIKQYLTQYNIQSVEFSKCSQNIRFHLKNIITGLDYKLEIENPLYNVLSKTDTNLFDFNDMVIKNQLDHLRTLTFSDDSIKEQYTATHLNSPYHKKYKTLEIEVGKKWASEYFTYLEYSDIDKIRKLSGLIDSTIDSVYGNFVKFSDNSLRFLFNQKYPVLDDVNEVLMCDFYLYTLTGQTYPIYHIIYTKNGSDDIYFEQSNMLVNSVNNKGSITVNLTQLFGDKQPTMLNDFRTLDGYNTKWFIVNNLFNCGIFYNTPKGIIRYIPITLDINFFNYIFNNIQLHDSQGNYKYINKGEDTQPKNISDIIKEKRIIPQNDLDNVELLSQILHLNSTAAYFNDVLFSMDSNEFNFPVYLVTDYDDYTTNYSYPNQD